MINVVIPILMILSATGIFFGFVSPGYESLTSLRAEVARYDEALQNAEELAKLRDELLAVYQSFSREDVDRLFAMLPDHVDNVKLGLDLDALARKHNLGFNQLMLSNEGGDLDDASGEDKSIGVGTTVITFSLEGTYVNLQAFLKDLETNLRIIDVVDVAFGGADAVLNGAQTFDISARIYWLK